MKLQFQRPLTDEALERDDARLVSLYQVAVARIVVERASLILLDQTLIRLGEMSCRFARPCSVSPPGSSWATAPTQSMMYNTGSSQAMHFNDQIASLKVVGYVGTSGGHLVS